MEPGHSLIDLAAAAHGVLSQFSRQHPQHLPAADPPPLDQAAGHPHVLDHPRVPPGTTTLGRRSSEAGARGFWKAVLAGAALIDLALPLLAGGTAIIGGAPLRRGPLTVRLPATKGTAQVVPTGIAPVGQKENAAVPAPGQAGAQMRLGPQHGPQHHVILQCQGGDRAPAVPVRPELKMFRDPDCKRPKLSLRMLTLNDMSPPYQIGTPVSRR